MTTNRLNSRDIRTAKIVALAANGVPLSTIAEKVECGKNTVDRALNKPESQATLQKVIDECEASINSQLPELLELSLNQLKNIIKPDSWAERSEKIRASEIILKTALKLSEISNRRA